MTLMSYRFPFWLVLVLGVAPIVVIASQQAPVQAGPTADQVFKNITVFKGVPANDLIPAMEFMCASLKYECSDCHDVKDFAAETWAKETARKMVLMQRDINAKNFGGRLEVTCMTCHNGHEHPATTPVPAGINLRHERMENAPKPDELFANHIAFAGSSGGMIIRTGNLIAPNDATHKIETTPIEFIQAPGGKFRIISGDRNVVSDGSKVWYGGGEMSDEALAIFGRIGRAWRGVQAFSGLERTTVTGKDEINKVAVVVVRGSRPTTISTEELYFDTKSGALRRMVNVRRSTLGSVLSAMDYEKYKAVGSVKVPMKVTSTFADGSTWTMDFKTVKVEATVDDALFKP